MCAVFWDGMRNDVSKWTADLVLSGCHTFLPSCVTDFVFLMNMLRSVGSETHALIYLSAWVNPLQNVAHFYWERFQDNDVPQKLCRHSFGPLPWLKTWKKPIPCPLICTLRIQRHGIVSRATKALCRKQTFFVRQLTLVVWFAATRRAIHIEQSHFLLAIFACHTSANGKPKLDLGMAPGRAPRLYYLIICSSLPTAGNRLHHIPSLFAKPGTTDEPTLALRSAASPKRSASWCVGLIYSRSGLR